MHHRGASATSSGELAAEMASEVSAACLEAKFDGAAGDVQVFADNTQIIDATAWPPAKAAFNTFEFGFATYHGPGRNIWYDDVVVAPTRVGCP